MKKVPNKWRGGKIGIQRRPHWGGDEGSERISHLWTVGGRGCSQIEHKWQRPHGKTVYDIFKEMRNRPVWWALSEQGRD